MGIYKHEKLRVTTDVVILTTIDNEVELRKVPTKTLQVLLIKRDEEPFNSMWTLPGVFIDSDKGITECLTEKLFSGKVGIRDIYKEQLATYGDNINRDPRDRVISVAYMALSDKHTLESSMTYGSKEKQWFNITQLNDGNIKLENEKTSEVIEHIGFDHKQMIIDAVNRLANKLVYTDIGFNIVAKEFTIKELQMAYECILNRKIYGFRRMVENKITETGQTTTDINGKASPHRPAKLYIKN